MWKLRTSGFAALSAGLALMASVGMADVSFVQPTGKQAYICSNSGDSCKALCKSVGKIGVVNCKYGHYTGTAYYQDKNPDQVKRICSDQSDPVHFCAFSENKGDTSCYDKATVACLCEDTDPQNKTCDTES